MIIFSCGPANGLESPGRHPGLRVRFPSGPQGKTIIQVCLVDFLFQPAKLLVWVATRGVTKLLVIQAKLRFTAEFCFLYVSLCYH